MQNLKNSLFLFFFSSLISACQSTKAFRLETFPDLKGELHIIQTNSDRVQQKCLFMNAEGDNNWRHQYFMYVLSDKSEVLEVMESTHTDGDSCSSQFHAVEKILKAEPQVKICVRDELRKSQVPDAQRELILFSSLGQHKVTHQGLTFDTICNSKKCVGDNSPWVDTCPGFVKQ
jgi:hypothetical protein